ncbi:hypothetical protein ERX46_04350 [Brumimicrobium glaciale]|uniref:Uncharacterized protein n=1 Tax=Brumimicrobium glaciale TaxID=200475 RepID=A0A4Q4KMJ0_9FLAO|nr:hypothetical protein [Brumimicrobium glaciale]RYM34611.1 hypothetical protein ERX46_04350 [Brumimicrobium glaciale]
MYITISQENRIAIEELREEAIQIKQEATELSISLLIQLKTVMFQFLLSYKEYSLTNIREYGLAEILMSRANRFFKLDQGDEGPKKSKEKSKSKFRFRIKSKTLIHKTKVNSRVEVKSKTNSNIKSKVKSRRGYKFIIKRVFKVILFPFYILILILGMLLGSESNEKSNKNVKNKYNPY